AFSRLRLLNRAPLRLTTLQSAPLVEADQPQSPQGSQFHSITSSARASNDCGTVRPSALAVLRLITNSNFVGCSTGISDGFAPFRIFATKMPACRAVTERFAP